MANDTNMGMSPIPGPNTGLAVAPGWPKPVGIISIAWAALGLACGAIGIVSYLAMPMMLKGAEEQLGPMPDVMKPQPTQMLVAGLSTVWAILLLAAGIATLKRLAPGRPMHLVYSLGAILLTLIGTYFAWQAHQAQVTWAAANASDKWAQQSRQGGAFAMAGMAFGVVLGMAWPTFCLVWFGLMGKRPETGRELLPQVI